MRMPDYLYNHTFCVNFTFQLIQPDKIMIIDYIENSARYEALHPSFKTAFDYLKQTDKEALDGLTDENAGVKMFAYKGEGKSKEKSLETFECHDKNIDIQFCISGSEGFLWKPRAKCI